MNTSVRILVFDSGVGGLSIVSEIKKRIAQADIVFAADNAGFPYGTKSEDYLVARILQVVTRMQEYCGADIIVVACNTASTVALDMLRARFEVPIVGVVPAIKPAAEQSRTGKIGLLATPATVAGNYTRQLIADFAGHCEVRLLGSSRLVEMAEQKLRGEPVDLTEISDILAPLTDFQGMDRMVLACTHFPLLRQEIQQVMGAKVGCVDSGEAIARRVESIVARSDFGNKQHYRKKISTKMLFTREDHLEQFFHCSDYWPDEQSRVIEVTPVPVV